MRRKLVKQGPASLTVSLPAPWVKANKLSSGQEVHLMIDKNRIVISADSHPEEESSIALDVRHLSNDFIGVLLASLHKKGYEEVRLTIEREQFAYIEQRISKNLLGFEIVKHAGETVIIRFVTKIDAEELPVLIRRTFLVTLSLAEGIAQSPEHAQDFLVLEETNNRLTNYCERIIVKSIHEHRNAIFEYIIIWLLEKIADEYRHIIKKKETNKEDATVCLNALKQFYELYYKYTLDKHNALVKALKADTEQLERRKSPFTTILHTLSNTGGSVIAMHVE